MSNPSKRKGTSAETALVNWARANGFPHADRQPLRGHRDQGDVTLTPGVIVEVKAHRLPTGYPNRAQLATWTAQTEAERVSAGADIGVLVVKRPGTTDPGRWFAHVNTPTFLGVLGVPDVDVPDGAAGSVVMLALDNLAILLRANGWGAPIEDTP